MTDQQGSLRFYIRADWTTRGMVKDRINTYLWLTSLKFDMHEEKHLWSSTYFYQVTGNYEVLKVVMESLKTMLREWNSVLLTDHTNTGI